MEGTYLFWYRSSNQFFFTEYKRKTLRWKNRFSIRCYYLPGLMRNYKLLIFFYITNVIFRIFYYYVGRLYRHIFFFECEFVTKLIFKMHCIMITQNQLFPFRYFRYANARTDTNQVNDKLRYQIVVKHTYSAANSCA